MIEQGLSCKRGNYFLVNIATSVVKRYVLVTTNRSRTSLKKHFIFSLGSKAYDVTFYNRAGNL